MYQGRTRPKNTIRIISVLNAYYRRITKIMRIACVLKAYWANMLSLICSTTIVPCVSSRPQL